MSMYFFKDLEKKEFSVSEANTLRQEIIKLTELNACKVSAIEFLWRTDARIVKS